jgi:FtsP/CotA-like multicopper oxidase with cupredoxin domain
MESFVSLALPRPNEQEVPKVVETPRFSLPVRSSGRRAALARSIFKAGAIVALVVSMATPAAQAVAAAAPKLCATPDPTTHQGPITNADRLAAAQRAAEARAACSVSLSGAKPAIAGTMDTPDYFGTAPNYANSPLPTDGAAVGFSGGGGTGASATATTVGGVVTSVTVSGGGAGYTSPPTVSFLGGTGAGATATANLTGSVGSVTVTSSGTGYTSAPVVTISGDGTGATARAALSGEVMSIAVATGGNGYTAVPPVLISGGGGGTGATATATTGLGDITVTGATGYATAPSVTIADSATTGSAATAVLGLTGITIGTPGTGYVNPVVNITGGGGTGATATATAGPAGDITAITITSPGTGYTSAPDVAIAGGGTGAVATATVGVVVTVTNPGTGNTTPPAVTLVGGGGTYTDATATLAVIGFTLTAGGTGYISAPTVTADGAGGIGATGTATIKADTLFAVTVTNGGKNYTTASVSLNGGGGSGAVASAAISGSVGSVTVTNGGAGYVTGGIRKFVDSLPGLGSANANDLGQYISIAIPDTTTYPGSDYYEIGLIQYRERLSSDLSPTLLRGYVQLETPVNAASSHHVALANANLNGTSTPILDSHGNQVYGYDHPEYLGTTIIAQKDRPVRVKFTNLLPTGSAGNLFIPVDTSVMGAGEGPLDSGGQPCDPMDPNNITTCASYTQNRATLHLHGGVTPWISDGTPNQWITPAGESTQYPKGVSVVDVPDMPDPGPGSETFFYTNQQSARLMFYHDHAYGITRLNVYSGEAAGYLVQDPTERALVASGVIPADEIPLVIQDKTFVPGSAQLAAEDPTWNTSLYGGAGNLWFPHVYMPNQNPYDSQGVNAMGRWDYGPWFWPPYTGITDGEVANPLNGENPEEGPSIPGIPNPSVTPEGFMDTPIVNGTVYPYLTVGEKAYRFQILNASNDRTWNLQLYCASSNGQMWDSKGKLVNPGAGEVSMVPAVAGTAGTAGYSGDILDGRAGGVPDVRTGGPKMIQIGTEGGVLPNAVTLPNSPIGYEYNRRSITVTNVSNKNLMLGPAERADVIVDFSQVNVAACSNIILYNDSPAPVPAFDPRYDYYTGDPDQTSTGGAPTTAAGYGPNTRTIMQFRVDPAKGVSPAFNTAALTAAIPAAFAQSQDQIIVPESAYNAAYGNSSSDNYVRIQDTQTSFTPMGSSSPVTIALQPKAIQELFEPTYGRMNATLGVELPNTTMINQTTIPLGYAEPYTEAISAGDQATPIGAPGDNTQIWKITHNGVDTHFIHFHLFNVQVINRVGWDGMVKPPDPNELGWKDTVRMNPLEDTIVALRPITPKVPFGIPDSIRPVDVTRPTTAMISTFNITNGNAMTVPNTPVDYGWEYVWHCHILGHEENDMMRPVKFDVPKVLATAPVLSVASSSQGLNLSWTDGTPTNISYGQAGTSWGSYAGEIGYRVNRAEVSPVVVAYAQIGTALANQTGFIDTTAQAGASYTYTVTAYNAAGDSPSNEVVGSLAPTLPGPPIAVTASAGNGQAAVSWTAPAADGQAPPISGYTVTSTPGGFTCNTSGALTCPVSGLANGTPYTFSVTATNGQGTGPASGQSNAVIPGTVPNAPTVVKAVAGPGSAAVTWTAPANPAIAVTGYTVTASGIGGQSCQTTGQLGCRVPGLTNGTSYTFTVTASNSFGSSLPAGPSNAVVPAPIPAAPTTVIATAGNAQATIRWLAPASTQGLTISGYTVTSLPGAQTCTTTSALTCTIGGLTNGSSYAFTVAASISPYGMVATSGASNIVTPATVPDAPTSVVAVAGDTSASVAWAVPANNGSAIIRYTVTSSPDNKKCTISTDSYCTVYGLTMGGTYTFKVVATNGIGDSLASVASAPVTLHAGSTFHTLTPTRLVDTRSRVGLSGPLVAGNPATFQVTGRGGVPDGATAVTGNVTVVNSSNAWAVFLGPDPTPGPTTSTINFKKGEVAGNGLTVALGPNGTLSATYISSPGNTTDLVFDITGYFMPDNNGATYHAMAAPTRLLDTRSNNGITGKLSAGVPGTFKVAGRGGVPANAIAVTGNVTVVNQTSAWAAYLGPDPTASPTTSTINFNVGDIKGNSLTVPLSHTGTLSATYMSSAGNTTDLVFDVTGYYTPDLTGAKYFPLAPTRLLDTRSGVGYGASLHAATPATFQVTNRGSVPSKATAVTGNVTVVNPTSSWAIFLGPTATATPSTSTINFNRGDIKGNGLTVALSSKGTLSATYMSIGGNTTDLVFDVTGYFAP